MKNLCLFIALISSPLLYSQTIILQPDAAAGKDASIFNLDALANYGTDPDFIATQWDYEGEPGTTRSILQFDLSGLPKGSFVTNAKLSLYYNPDSQTPGQSGSNAAYIRRLIQPWDENTVAWNMQPLYTMENEVLLPASTFEDQSYENIDVTALVIDMVSHPNSSHGFMFMLQTEQGLNSMKFASSDHPNIFLHPKLEITYSSTATHEINYKNANVSPNPFYNELTLSIPEGTYEVNIADLNGLLVHTSTYASAGDNIIIDRMSDLPAGVYFLKATNESGNYFSKVVKSNE